MTLVLAALLIGATPQPARAQPVIAQKDVCALVGQSVTRLGADIGERSQVEEAVQRAESLRSPHHLRFRQNGLRFRGPWGRCRIAVAPGSFVSKIEEIRISADGGFAIVSGGWVADALLGSGGDCYFRKAPVGWALIGCAHSWSV